MSVIDPRDWGFGLAGNTGVDNARALNRATAEIRNGSIRFEPGHTDVLRIPSGRWPIGHDTAIGPGPVGWDATMCRRGPFQIDARGAKLVADETLAGGVIVDMLGSQEIVGNLPVLFAPLANHAPRYGLQMGFRRNGEAPGGHDLAHLRVIGHFSGGGVINAAAEGCRFPGARVQNFHPDPAAYAWIADGDTRFPVVTNLDTSGLTPNAVRTNLLNDLRGIGLYRIQRDQATLIDAPCLWLGVGDHASLSLASFYTTGAAIEMGARQVYNGIDMFGVHAERPSALIRLASPVSMKSCRVVTGYLSHATAFIDTSGHKLTIEDCDIDPGSAFGGDLIGGGGPVTMAGVLSKPMRQWKKAQT